MKRFGQLHLKHPFKGARMLRDQLHEQGIMIGSKHVKILMTWMGIEAVHCKPNTSNKTRSAR
jgi:putative transposase